MHVVPINANRFVTIRIRETGQVTEMAPAVAREMLNSGYAERVEAKTQKQPESAMVKPRSEQATAPAQKGPAPKSGRR